MIDLVDLEGSPAERGRAFGAMRRGQIAAWMSAWFGSLVDAGIDDPSTYVETMLANTRYLDSIAHHIPELLEEVLEIAAGSCLPFAHIMAAQLLDEEWAYRTVTAGANGQTQKCSCLAMKEYGGPVWIAQNMDLGPYTDGHQIMLRVGRHKDHPAAAIFSVGGMIGLLGVNEVGLAVCVSSLPQLPSRQEGVPVSFVVRRLLEMRDLAGAGSMLAHLPHATSQHYLLADQSGIRSFEVSATSMTEYTPTLPGRIFHTNHVLAAPAGSSLPELALRNTRSRLSSLEARLSATKPSLAVIQQALSACDDPHNPVCRAQVPDATRSNISFTTGSMISRIASRDEPVQYWVSAGPPCLRGYAPFAIGAEKSGG